MRNTVFCAGCPIRVECLSMPGKCVKVIIGFSILERGPIFANAFRSKFIATPTLWHEKVVPLYNYPTNVTGSGYINPKTTLFEIPEYRHHVERECTTITSSQMRVHSFELICPKCGALSWMGEVDEYHRCPKCGHPFI